LLGLWAVCYQLYAVSFHTSQFTRNSVFSKQLLVYLQVLRGKAAEYDLAFVFFGLGAGFYCHLRRLFYWVSVNPGADAGEGYAAAAQLGRQFEGVGIAVAQQLGFALVAAVPDRAHGVDDVFGFKVVGFGGFGLAGGTAAQGAAFGQQAGAGGFMYGAVHSPAAQEHGVGGVDDGVCLEGGDVGKNGLHTKVCLEINTVKANILTYNTPNIIKCFRL